MADNRTIAQLLQAPTEGYEDAIVIPDINANFELKHGLINLVQNKQFFGHDKEDPHAHIHVFALTTEVSELKNLMKTMLIDKQKAQVPATVKAVEQSCVTCGANFNQGNTNSRPLMVSNQIRPPGFPPIQNNQNRFNPNQGNNFNQNRGTNFNQNRGSNFNQGQVYQPPTNQPPVYQVPPQQMQGVSKTDFENYVKANDVVLRNMQNQGQGLQNQMTNLTEMLSKFITSNTASSSNSGTLPSQTVTNPREHVNAITTRSGKTCEEPSTPLVPTPVVSTPLKEPEQNPETSMDRVQKPSSKNTAQVPPLEDHDFIFIEIPKPKAKKTVSEPNSQNPDSYQPKLPYPERMKVRENDTPSAQQSRFMKLFKQLRLEIGLKDALIEMPKFNKWLNTLLRNKEKLEEISITTINVECSAIILNKVPEKLEDPGKFLIPCALQELDRTNALANSGASIIVLPHSIYKQLGLGALKPTRMTLELANRSVTHPMGIAEDVVVRVDGFTFLADFVMVNFEPYPRVPIILGRPFLRTAKALIDLYEEKLTLRVGSDELVFYAENFEKSKNKQFAHAISVIDFLKDEPFSGNTTNHSDTLPPSSSLVRTSDNLEEFADELTLLKKVVHEENFQVYSNPLFEFDDNFTSSNENPLFNEMDEDVVNENSNVSDFDEPVLLNTPLSDKVECSNPKDEIDEIDAFLAMEVSLNFEEGYFDSEGDVIFLENLLSDDTTHNLAPEVISDHEPIHNTSITFSLRSDPLHHEFAGELLTLPSRIENVHANPSSIIESLPTSIIPVEDNDPVQEEIDIFLVPNDLIPPGVENDDSEDEDNELPNLDHQDNPSSLRPPPKPLDVCLNFNPATAMRNEDFNQGEIVLPLNVEDVNSFTFVIWTFLPFFTYPEDSPVILSLRNEDLLFEAEGFILPNHDTGRILPAESQRNTIDPLVAATDSSVTDYDSVDESSVCSTLLPPLKMLDGAEPISGPKTIKSILRSKSTFKAETLKGVIINEPSLALVKDNKISSASKVNSAPGGKLKNVKIKDDPPLSIIIKVPDICTDKAKITRKRSKPDKHEHGNGRARKKPGESYQRARRTIQVVEYTLAKINVSHEPSLVNPKKECHVGLKKAQGKGYFALILLSKEAQRL
ncbi:reverse transcriptase domain-containing protein [Tanacetum coccineum]